MREQESSPLLMALHKAVLLGSALLVAPAFAFAADEAPAETPAAKKPAVAARTTPKKADASKPAKQGKPGKAATAKKDAEDAKPGPLADFGKVQPPADVEHVANWVSYTHNNQKKAFVLIDKKQARLYVFDPKGKLKSDTPILLGQAVGDDSAPGVGNKPISQMKPNEKTTPAGRFRAEPGKNSHGEDIIWIDYNAAISMHRMRKVSEAEHRAERMATPDVGDNRISYGCVNVPPQFYNTVLKPTVLKQGAYVYVLPETRTVQQQFGSFDVKEKAMQLAQAPEASKGKTTQ